MLDLFNPKTIIYIGGIGLLGVIVFAETGLLLGIIFPGDSLLFTAGLLTAVKVIRLPLAAVVGLVGTAAFLGDQSGYWIGWRTGQAFFNRPKSLFFRPEYVVITRNFYRRHGSLVLILGKFLPIIRTFAPLLAGIIQMPYRKFIIVSVIGSASWAGILIPLGYFLGNISWVQTYYEWIILGIVIITTGPVIWRLIRAGRRRISV
ncbi:MAG: VTT domain-containing protein [Bacteroidia bacterium]|nr:VTT domain-containing protein [Bacteroidia bacterium]MDW8015537.1 VTT domain-containing protein [Bacteroidia bacterium]